MKNRVQLITYVDRLGGGDLRDLHDLLRGPLSGLFGAVHLLPFFWPTDGSDAGFDPIDHTMVDPRLGGWNEIRALSSEVEIMADVIVNHISSKSPQFLDWSAVGDASAFAGLFLTFGAVFPNGATEDDLLAIYRPRPGLPFSAITLAHGRKHLMWTTFTAEQIDIDVRHQQGAAYLAGILDTFADHGIRMVRLDAAGYAIKRAGASSFMMPETFDFIDDFTALARAKGIEVLVEIHSYYRRQIEIARRVDWVYDFALPPLVLHAFLYNTAAPLKSWIAQRPANAVTVLDTHDGIGVIDIGADSADPAGRPGLIPPEHLDALVESIHANSKGASRLATGAAASNLDLYQVNCTFYDALGQDDRAYLLARATQFFLPGVPQIYYVGLLAGENDLPMLKTTGVGRDINRHRYTRAEVEASLGKPVVGRLLELIRFRNSHPAFGGEFTLLESTSQILAMRWACGSDLAELRVDFSNVAQSTLAASDGTGGVRSVLLIDGLAAPRR